MKFLVSVLILISISILFDSCTRNEPIEYTVTGKVVYYQKSVEGIRLEFYRSYPEGYRTFTEYLGSTICDSTGNFSFSYETEKNMKSMEVEIFKGNQKIKYIKDLPFATNWNTDLNVSDSAYLVFVYNSSNPLVIGDTLFIGTSIGIIRKPGPLLNGTRDTITVANRGQALSWVTDLVLRSNEGSTGLFPTGAPNIDVIQINYQNKP